MESPGIRTKHKSKSQQAWVFCKLAPTEAFSCQSPRAECTWAQSPQTELRDKGCKQTSCQPCRDSAGTPASAPVSCMWCSAISQPHLWGLELKQFPKTAETPEEFWYIWEGQQIWERKRQLWPGRPGDEMDALQSSSQHM